MNINPTSNSGTCGSPRLTKVIAALAIVTAGFVAAACTGSISHSYRTFQSALDRGASCEELFDQRARFHNEDTLAKVDRDLARIGCASPESTRKDD